MSVEFTGYSFLKMKDLLLLFEIYDSIFYI